MLITALNAVLCCCYLEGRVGEIRRNKLVWFSIFLIGIHQWPNKFGSKARDTFLYCDLWCSPQSTFSLSDIAAG
jgi:hypothetical protein